MRGKISYYNENTHTGMVVDKAKVGYEFKGSIWHDKHRPPAAGMYVDFKANDNGRVEQNKALFERYVKQFRESKFNEFIGSFGFETELKGVVDALNTIMNRIAYNYDTMLWQNAINSHIVVGTFFRQATEGNYCAATFLRYYLKPLNKRALNKTDEALYNYLLKYDNLVAKHILVLSDNKSAADTAAMAVYKSFKDAVAHRFLRAADSLFHIRQSRAVLALFDEQNQTLSVDELAQSYAEAHGSQRFHILVFNAKKQSARVAFDSIEIVRIGGCDERIISDKIIEILG